MSILRFRIRLLSPVIISTSSESNLTRTLQYIPGSTILGLFAASYLRNKPRKNIHEDPIFYKWFLNGELSFFGAFPLFNLNDREYTAYPAPFCLEQGKQDDTEVYNLLYYQNDELSQDTRKISSYIILSGDKLMKVEPEKILRFHHSRKDFRFSGTTDEGNIFNYEALAQGQEFAGYILGLKEELVKFKQVYGDNFNTRIGKSKSTEYGAINVQLAELIDEVYAEQEIETNGYWEDNEAILTFISPCILKNSCGTTEVSTKILENYLEQYFEEDIAIVDQFIGRAYVENYLSVWQMKRPLDFGLSPGSTFKITFKTRNSLSDDVLIKLKNLQITGLGERCHEGFGQIKINWPVKDKYTVKYGDIEPVEPGGKIPAQLGEIFSYILTEDWKQKVQAQALSDVSRFMKATKKLPTNSLLGKLLLIVNSDPKSFSNYLCGLRTPALDQLKACHNEQQTLMDYIKGFDDNRLTTLFQELPEKERNIKSFLKINLENDLLIENLYKLYWTTFLREMRNQNKRKELTREVR